MIILKKRILLPNFRKLIREKIDTELIRIATLEQAKKSPCPFTTFSLFYNLKFITHEIQSEKKFEKIIDSLR